MKSLGIVRENATLSTIIYFVESMIGNNNYFFVRAAPTQTETEYPKGYIEQEILNCGVRARRRRVDGSVVQIC